MYLVCSIHSYLTNEGSIVIVDHIQEQTDEEHSLYVIEREIVNEYFQNRFPLELLHSIGITLKDIFHYLIHKFT